MVAPCFIRTAPLVFTSATLPWCTSSPLRTFLSSSVLLYLVNPYVFVINNRSFHLISGLFLGLLSCGFHFTVYTDTVSSYPLYLTAHTISVLVTLLFSLSLHYSIFQLFQVLLLCCTVLHLFSLPTYMYLIITSSKGVIFDKKWKLN